MEFFQQALTTAPDKRIKVHIHAKTNFFPKIPDFLRFPTRLTRLSDIADIGCHMGIVGFLLIIDKWDLRPSDSASGSFYMSTHLLADPYVNINKPTMEVHITFTSFQKQLLPPASAVEVIESEPFVCLSVCLSICPHSHD